MKKIILVVMIALIAATATFAHTKKSAGAGIEAKIIALEKEGWEAWKNKNTAWFQSNTTAEFLSISSGGISDKAQVIKSTATDCDVKSVSIDDFKFVMLNKKAVLLTYTAIQDGVCGETKLAPKLRVSVNYVKRGEKWLEAFYMETPIVE